MFVKETLSVEKGIDNDADSHSENDDRSPVIIQREPQSQNFIDETKRKEFASKLNKIKENFTNEIQSKINQLETNEINEKLTPLHKALFIESSPSPVKYAASQLNLCNDDVRLPLVKITDETKEKVKSAMKYANLI